MHIPRKALLFIFTATCLQLSAATLSTEKLTEMGAFFSAYVDEGKMAGFTTLVSLEGKIVHFDLA